MAHFAIVCPDDVGHLLSSGSVGKELVRRGHRVTMVGRDRAGEMAQKLGLPLHSFGEDGAAYSSSWLLGAACCVCRVQRADRAARVHPLARRDDLGIRAAGAERTGRRLALVDQVTTAGGTAAERAGVPFVTICSAMPWNEDPAVPPAYTAWPYAAGRQAQWRNRLGYAAWHWFIRPTLRTINRRRRRWNLPEFSRIDDTFSPLAQISQLCRELDFPRGRLPDTFHYVGSLGGGRHLNASTPFPWERLDGRPLIFASLGTVSEPTNLAVYRKMLAACAGLNVQVVLALGRWTGEEEMTQKQLGDIPDNAIVVDFAPQLALLERAALLITHAGINTVMESLSQGVPMIALPRSADQPATASRVAHAGVGLQGSYGHSTVEELREMVERVLAEDCFRRRAKELQQTLIAAGGASRAADIAEEVLATGRPVRRAL